MHINNKVKIPLHTIEKTKLNQPIFADHKLGIYPIAKDTIETTVTGNKTLIK